MKRVAASYGKIAPSRSIKLSEKAAKDQRGVLGTNEPEAK